MLTLLPSLLINHTSIERGDIAANQVVWIALHVLQVGHHFWLIGFGTAQDSIDHVLDLVLAPINETFIGSQDKVHKLVQASRLLPVSLHT